MLHWDNITVGTRIPELVVCPSHMQVFMFSAVTWNRHHIHYSKDAAVREGLPDVVVQRALIGNFLARLLTNWVGDVTALCRLEWKVTRSAVPGEEIICRGEVTEKTESDRRRCVVCEVTASKRTGETIASGNATVALGMDSEAESTSDERIRLKAGVLR